MKLAGSEEWSPDTAPLFLTPPHYFSLPPDLLPFSLNLPALRFICYNGPVIRGRVLHILRINVM